MIGGKLTHDRRSPLARVVRIGLGLADVPDGMSDAGQVDQEDGCVYVHSVSINRLHASHVTQLRRIVRPRPLTLWQLKRIHRSADHLDLKRFTVLG